MGDDDAVGDGRGLVGNEELDKAVGEGRGLIANGEWDIVFGVAIFKTRYAVGGIIEIWGLFV